MVKWFTELLTNPLLVYGVHYYQGSNIKLRYEAAQRRRYFRGVSRIERRLSVPLAIIVVAAVVVAALLVVLSQMSGGEEEAQELLAGVPQDGTTLGAEDASVTIYLYEDLQCPVCARFSRETFPELVTRYVEPGEVKVVSETLAILGPDSVPAAEAALAAGEQDHYWEYSTLFFLNQGRENSGYVTDEFLTGIAEKTQGLDVDQWNEARESGSFESEVDAAKASAEDEGIQGTPTLIVSGPQGTRQLVGAVPIDDVAAAIDEVRES
jgi:protein-disulfide isomerase